MAINWYFIFGTALLESFVLALVLTPMFRAIALRFDFLDRPGERKLQTKPVPLLGGAAIVLAFTATIAVNAVLLRFSGTLGFAWVEEHVLRFFGGGSVRNLVGLALGGIAIFVLGLLDDLNALTPERKLVGQIVCAAIPVAFGIRGDLFLSYLVQELSSEHVDMLQPFVPWVSAILSILWLVTIINAMNFIDNMDGLCAGISAIAAGAFFVCVVAREEYFTAVTLVIFAGSVLGFLYHNLPPARIFMGDAGAMFCGYVLGALAIVGTFYSNVSGTRLAVAAPLVALSVPLFDMASVVWLRLRRGESIMKGDKRHFSHRLVELGLTQRQAVEFIYLVAVLTGLSAALLVRVGYAGTAIIFAHTLGLFVAIVVLMRPRAHTGADA